MKVITRSLILVAILVGIINSTTATNNHPPENDTRIATVKKHVYYLASDKLEGRMTGTKGAKLAAKYICDYYDKMGLTPVIGKKYTHAFTYTYKSNPHSTTPQKDKKMKANNVLSYLDNGASKTILIGAHYDHLGVNEHHNSSSPNATGEIHNGADDNASGVAAVLELARILSQNDVKEKANFVFACFSAEEDGLMGSKNLANYFRDNNMKLDLMINMDMVGRLNDKKLLHVGGIGTSPSFGQIIENNKPAGYQLSIDSSGVGPTDHTSFYLKDYPVLNFFTGTHTDYHKPSDDAYKINYEGIIGITDYIYDVVIAVAELESIPFTKTRAKPKKSKPRYKVTLGIMPDYVDYGDGLHIEVVTEDRPAHKAGMKDGDILLKINDCKITEVYSYMDCLSKFKAGDKATVTYKRGSEVKTSEVTF